MGAISLDEYKKKKQTTKQEVARPNTILYSDYNTKYGNQKLPTEVTRTGNSFLLPTVEQPQIQETEKTYKKIYNKELEKQKKIKNQIDSDFYDKGVQTTTGAFSTQRNILPTQQQTEITKNKKFEVYDNPLEKNQEIEKKFQDIKSSNDYREKQKKLIEQSNKVGYAKYDYDKSTVDNDNIGFLDKTLGTITRGAKSLFDMSGGLINENGNTYYLPNKSELKQEKTQNSYDTKIGKLLGSAGYEIGKIGASTLMNQVLPGTGTGLYWSRMLIDGTNNAMREGYDSGSALAYGAVNTGFEYLTGKLLGSATKGLTGGKSSGYEELLNDTFNKLLKKPGISKILATAGSEATEEFVQEFLDNITKSVILDKDMDYSWVLTDSNVFSDAIYSALVGSITGGTLGTITGNNTNVENNKDGVYDILASELENTKKNINNEETIKTIDNVLENINDVKKGNTSIDNNEASNIESLITEYEELQNQENISKKQEQRMVELQKQISELQNHLTNAENITTKNILPTVNDIVARENKSKMSVSEVNNDKRSILPSINDSKNQILPSKINSNAKILPVANNFTENNVNIPLTIKSPKISPETAQKIGNIINNKDSNVTYTSSYISSILKEAGIKVPTSFQYVENISSDLINYETTKKLTDNQDKQIKNALSNLRSIDTTSVNNMNKAIVSTNNIANNQIVPTNQNISYSQNTNLSFDEQLDLWSQGKWNNRSQLVLFKNTPQLYLELGLKDNPITISASKLDRVVNKSGNQNGNYHNLGLETTKRLPEAIANPLNILESSTVDDSIVVVTELSDSEDRIVIVSMAIDGTGRIEITDVNNKNEIKNIPSNVMTSAYGRNNYDMWMNQNKDRIIYDKDDGIIKKRVNGDWLQLPIRNNSTKVNGDRLQLPKGVNYIGANGQWVQFPNVTNSKANVSAGNTANNSITPTLEASAFSDNNIPQVDNNVKSNILPINNNMQNKGINTKKKTSSNVNLPSIKNDDVLRIESKRIAKEINETGGFNVKERSWVETSTKSETLKDKVFIKDLDPSKINYLVQSNKSSINKANNYLDTYGYEETLKHVNELLKNDNLPSASDVALMQRMIQEASKRGDIETVQNLIMDTAILGTDLGQATQALSIIQRLTPEGQLKLYTKIVQRAKIRGEKSFQNVKITPEMVQTILDAYQSDGTYDQNDLNDRVERFKQDIANQLETTTAEKINAWRYLAMLGNPKTHIRNIVSNVAMSGTIKVKNAMARTIESLIPLETKTKTWKRPSQVIQNFASKTAMEMKSIITGEAKYNEKSSLENKKRIFKNEALEKISNFNGNALEAEDWFFSKRAFKNTLQEYLTANGITTENDINNNPELIEKAKQYAVEQAEIATFRQYSALAAKINQLEKGKGVSGKATKLAVEATTPFKKTPINVAKAGVKYSPIGLIKNISYDVYQLKTDNINASQFIDNLSQGLTGTSLAILGYALAKAGILSGAGDDDKENKYDSQLGSQNYAMNIGGKSYSISWLSPVAMPLLVGSNAYEKLEKEEEWNPDIVATTLAETLDPLSEMSFVSSLTNVLTSYNTGSATMIKDIGETATQSYIMQFFPTLFSQVASTLDEKKRSTKVSNNSAFKFGEETVRKIMYKIPGLRNQLEVTTDIWGNEKEQSDNIIERAFESFLTPYSKTSNVETNLDKQIKKIYNETGESKVIPSIPYAYVKYKDTTYRMSASEYTKYKKTYGTKSYEYLSNLVETKAYKNATADDKAKMISNIYGYAKAEANEMYFKNTDVNYENDELKELKELRNLGINNKSFAEYISNKTQASSIRNSKEYNTAEKKEKISNMFIETSLNNKQLAYLYGKYYSSDKVLNNLVNANVPIKEFIKFNSQDFESDYNSKGEAITNSKKNKVMRYINSLNLTVAQKAILIKMEYNSFNSYDRQIINYVNDLNCSKFDKASMLKMFGFSNYDKYLINEINGRSLSAAEKETVLKELGFKIRNGRVYTK